MEERLEESRRCQFLEFDYDSFLVISFPFCLVVVRIHCLISGKGVPFIKNPLTVVIGRATNVNAAKAVISRFIHTPRASGRPPKGWKEVGAFLYVPDRLARKRYNPFKGKAIFAAIVAFIG